MNLSDHQRAQGFKEAAERFCALLESDPADTNRWVEEVLTALSVLYAAGNSLPDVGLDNEAPDIPDSLDVMEDEWRAVFSRVQNVLGEQDAYWAYFDPSEPAGALEEPIFRSLADDLADIYRDIMPGLRGWAALNDLHLETIVFDWKTATFGSHWGRHAVSAMRALHPIVFDRGVSGNVEPSGAANSAKRPPRS